MTTMTVPKTRAMGFSELEIEYVSQLLKTGDPALAQQSCAISTESIQIIAQKDGYHNLIRQMAGRVFIEILAPKALARLQEYANKEAKPDRAQLDAVKTILDRVGFIAPKAVDPVKADKDLEDMTTEELHDYISKGEQVIASRLAHNAPVNKPQVIDVLD